MCTMEAHRPLVWLVDLAVDLNLGRSWALRTNFMLDLHQTAFISTTGSKQFTEVCALHSYDHVSLIINNVINWIILIH